MRASGAVRLIEAGRRAVSELEREVAADWELSRQQAAYVARFNQAMQLDALFQSFFRRYAEFPRDFLDWAGVGRGAAVLEAGCGGGRLTFEGGLADQVGPQGLVLAADPSVAMLRQAWRKREERRISHVHFLKAPAERLPIRDAQVDWAVGMNFFHYTHRERALRELLRVTRPGGQVALVVGVGVEYPAAGARAMALLREALARRGLGPPQDYLDPPGATVRLFRRLGPKEVAAVEASEEGVFTDFEMAFRYLTQVSYLDSQLEALGEGETLAKLRLALLVALEEGFKEATPAQRVAVGRYEFVRGRVPGGPEEPEGGGEDEGL
jgi:SAM-dependent methyltransferase